MKSVAFYLPNLAAGGAERTFLRLATGFKERGCAVGWVVDRLEGGLLETVRASGFNLDCLNAGRTLAALPKLRGWLRQRRPDVLLSAITHNNLIAAWAGKLSGAPTRVVVSEHTVLSAQAASQAGWQYRILAPLCRWAYPHAAAIVVVSAGAADDLARYTGLSRERMEVIPNPVVTPDYPQRIAAPSPHPWLADGGPPVFVAAGRLVPLKDFPTLLQALAHVRRRAPARLLVIGEGPERDALLALRARLGLDEAVEFPGFYEDPLPLFARAAALVVSSRFEGFGLTLVEALACGTPVVSTDCPTGPVEILERGAYGRLAPVGDADALARALLETLNATPDRERLCQRAQDYTLAAVVERYLALFDRLESK
ncbi:MAG: glycosyltransferase [Candidatus Competibacter sp.]|jgi:glycosyltransferase involved in cell wall biosynthesis|nr:glycosyltransferase [Candidatus Competibacteraceae bacterium]